MFPYKSAVGFFIIQILKALALIKAGRIYPVPCDMSAAPKITESSSGHVQREVEAEERAEHAAAGEGAVSEAQIPKWRFGGFSWL